MRKAYYVPETKHCDELFKEMSESHVQMAIVVDEYGGTAGLVTLEDVLESIVGNIQDEYDNEDEEISKINDTTFTIDGITDLDEVDELIGADLPEGDYDTLGGFITSQLGKVRVEILPQGEAPVEEPDAGEKKRRRLLHERDAEETSEENAEPKD